MIYLKKDNQEAIKFVTDFIYANWLEQNDGSYKYQNIGYPDIKNPIEKYKGFFINDQEDKCCYCCKDIINDRTTELEHIIPRTKSHIEDFQPYFVLSYILKNNVVPQNIFEEASTILSQPPFPHHIAYQNIVASCNGRIFETTERFTCCNRERKDDFIPPFNLMPDAIQYLPDGTIVYMKDILNRNYFETLSLDKDILTNIRRLWYLFAQSELTIDQILDEQYTASITEKIVRFAIANSSTAAEDTKLVETFSNQSIWNIFKDYSYFFNYYKK